MLVRLPSVDPLCRNDVQPTWLLYRPKPRVCQSLELIFPLLGAKSLCTRPRMLRRTGSASAVRSLGA